MTRVDALCLLSTGHLLRILIPLEEPPHLTEDIIGVLGLAGPDFIGVLIRVGSPTLACGVLQGKENQAGCSADDESWFEPQGRGCCGW